MADTLRIPFADDLPVLLELARRLAPATPAQAFKAPLGLTLIGVGSTLLTDSYAPIPFGLYQLHREADDAPEFLPLLRGAEGQRFGLWIDDLAETPDFVVVATVADDGAIAYRVITRNLIELLRLELERREALPPEQGGGSTPERNQLRDLILPFATADRLERGQEYLDLYARRAQGVRERIVQATTPDGMGIRARGYDPHQMPSYSGDAAGLLEQAAVLIRRELPANALAVAKPLLGLTRHTELEGPTRAVLAEAYRALGREAFARLVAG